MRLLVFSACLCLLALPGSDAGLDLERLSGGDADKTVLALAVGDDSAAPGQAARDSDETRADVPLGALNLSIEYPAPGVLDAALLPPPLPPVAKPVILRSDREICDSLVESAQSNDLPIPFFIHLLFQESGFRAGVVSSAGAQGIAQFMPETAATVGLDNPFDPLEAIPASARLLRDLMQKFGNLGLAAAAYNAGARRVQDWLDKKGKLPDETQHYVKTITGRPAESWTGAKPGNTDRSIPRRAPCREHAAVVAAIVPEPPLPLARPAEAPGRAEKMAMRAPAKPADHAAQKRANAVKDKPVAGAHAGTRAGEKHGKKAKSAVQLAADRRKAHRKVQLSQR
jgi:Transglycosylase SLT domain